MDNANPNAFPDKPPIHMIDEDYDIIARLALGLEHQSPELSELLLDEIDRAEIHDRADVPPDVVTIGSEVEYLEVETKTTHRVQLVMPADADIEAKKISILTPMGAGLIGLRTGQSIAWPRSGGHLRQLRIESVRQPAGASGGEENHA